MKVNIQKIQDIEDERVVIECVEETKDVIDIKKFAMSRGSILMGSLNERLYRLNLHEVLFFEAVGEHVFAYAEEKVYEIKGRLYEIEDAYRDKQFLRCSKSVVLNLMKIESISPALNGRFIAHLVNKEKVMITRQYVSPLKAAVLGGS